MESIRQISKQGYLLETYRLFYLNDRAGQEFDFHYHEFNKIVIPLAGRVSYRADDATYALRPWDVLLIKHHTIHRADIDLSVPYERYILYISPNFIERQMPGEGLQDCFDGEHRLLQLKETQRTQLAALLQELLEEQQTPLPDSSVLCRVLLLRMLILLRRVEPSDRQSAVTYDGKMTPILSYINEHLDQPLTVDDIAKQAYLSRSHFMRMFKERMGCTVYRYLRQKRLARAAQLITEGVPAGKAAEESGFTDYSVFLRAFRQVYHTNPTQWKP